MSNAREVSATKWINFSSISQEIALISQLKNKNNKSNVPPTTTELTDINMIITNKETGGRPADIIIQRSSKR